jgi:hypothetical protein
MAGRLIASGQTYVIDAMKYYIDNFTSGLYVGLMTNTTTPSESDQLGAGITEISLVTSSGYSRQLVDDWGTSSGVDPILSGATATFNVSGTWASVEGYFVSESSTGNDALWAEVFPTGKGGDKHHGDRVLITPRFEEQYKGEA